jgi:hypothetical protein
MAYTGALPPPYPQQNPNGYLEQYDYALGTLLAGGTLTPGGGNVTTVFGRTGAVVATAGDYTAAQVTGAAPLASPALTGTPTAPTAAVSTNTTQLSTTAFVLAQIAAIGLAAVATSGSLSDCGGTLSLAQLPTGACFWITWDGTTAHDMAGNVIVARPSSRTDIVMCIQGGPAATPPAFAITHDQYYPTS